jgi:uncharacterized protein YgbK (DUF1537 family)
LADALHGVVLGSERFVSKVRRLLKSRKDDPEVPALREFETRPTIERITQAVCEVTAADPARWIRGRRNDDASRAMTAYVARVSYGYSSKAVAAKLGYSWHSAVHRAIGRVTSGGKTMARTLEAVQANLASD